MADKRVVGITGATGFVGQALIRDLTPTRDVELRLFSCRPGGAPDGPPTEALRPTLATLKGVDTLVHLAALTTSKAPERTLVEVNVALAADLLTTAIEAGVRRFVFFSSLHVHGKGGDARRIGPDDAFAPVNAYGRSKAAAERALDYINRDNRIELVVIRPPMIYGPGGKGSFNALFKLLRTGAPLPFGAACAERSFCSIRNVVSATRAALDAPNPPRVLLPADPDDFSTRSLIETMATAAGIRVRLVPAPAWSMKLLLGGLGQGDMAASLFEPLVVDRSGWAEWNWVPVESGRQAVADTIVHMTAARG